MGLGVLFDCRFWGGQKVVEWSFKPCAVSVALSLQDQAKDGPLHTAPAYLPFEATVLWTTRCSILSECRGRREESPFPIK